MNFLERQDAAYLLEDELILKTRTVDDQPVDMASFEKIGLKIRDDFEKETKFGLVLSGRIVGTETYVNVWETQGLQAVHDAWSLLGGHGPLQKDYAELNNMVLLEDQNLQQRVLFSGNQRPVRQGYGGYYVRLRYHVQTEDLIIFKDHVAEASRDWGQNQDIQLVSCGLANTGKLNVFSVFLWIEAEGQDRIRGRTALDTSSLWLDEKLAHVSFHSLRFRPYPAQILVPTSFDKTKKP